MKTSVLALLAALAPGAGAEVLPEALPAPDKPGVSGGLGAALTGGSGGYGRVAVYGDALWLGDSVSPYAWTEYGTDSDARRFSLGGGAWKELSEALRFKGGLGFSVGRFRAADAGSNSVTFETGLERDLERPTVGAEYRRTAGSIGGSTATRGGQRVGQGQLRGRAAAGTAAVSERFSYDELSGYARLPAGAATVGLRAAVGFPSYGSAIVSETLSGSVPLSGPLAARLAVSFEQGARAAVYASGGLDYRFE